MQPPLSLVAGMNLFGDVAAGSLAACQACPRNPRRGRQIFYGYSCPEHQSDGTRVDVMWIMRDPGREVASTGRLCVVHNLGDPTSRHALQLLRYLGIGGRFDETELRTISADAWFQGLEPHEIERLRGIYATNAVMHGATDGRALNRAAGHCYNVLGQLIEYLRPRVLLAFGDYAADSLWRIAHQRKATRPLYHLWDGNARFIHSLPAFFLFHHSPRGLANAAKYRLNTRHIWKVTARAIRQQLGWT